MMRSVLTVLLVLLTSLAAFDPAAADQHDQRLKSLFDTLKTADTPEKAGSAEMQIWQIWSDTGDAKLDGVLQEGSVAMAMHDFPKAMKSFNTLIEQKPDFAEGWNKRATLYYLMGRYQESIADIDHVLELEPRHFGALAGLGLINIQLEREEAAKDAFERVLDVYPLNSSARQNLDYVKKKIAGSSL